MADQEQQADENSSPSAGEQVIATFDQFQGVNTQTTRPGVPDNQAYWLDGFMPLAPRNLRTLYGINPTPLYTAPGGVTIVFFYCTNLGTTPLHIVFLSDGSVIQVNSNTGATTTILPTSTITVPSQINCGVSQWNEQYILIVSPDGYWAWDNTTLYGPGTLAPGVVITNVGSGYASTPSVYASGGHGTGATFVASLAAPGIVASITMTNPGSGYLANDVVSLVITPPTGGGSGASLTANLVSGVAGSKTVGSVSIVSGGAGYGPAATVGFSGGTLISGGSGATGFLTLTGGTITAVNITYGGYYTSGSAAPTVTVTDTGVGATGTISLMPQGVKGTTVETYSGHVWIADGANVVASAPGSLANFAPSAGGVQFTSTSSVLRYAYTRLLATNGFLYLVGDSSIDYISGVQTTNTTTTFTIQNADPQVGSPYVYSINQFGREIMVPNSVGVFVMYGGAATKVSDMLDGVYSSVNNFGGLILSSSQATIFGRKVWMMLTQIIDPLTGQIVNKLLMWDRKRWWAATQDVALTYINYQEINSTFTPWGTDDHIIFELFKTPSTAITKVARSKMWDKPLGYQGLKANSRFWLLAEVFNLTVPLLEATIETESTTDTAGTFIVTNVGYFVSSPQAIGQQGVLFGMTITTTAEDLALISASVDAALVGYRG